MIMNPLQSNSNSWVNSVLYFLKPDLKAPFVPTDMPGNNASHNLRINQNPLKAPNE